MRQPRYRAFVKETGTMHDVTQLEWNGDGLKYVYVFPGVNRKYSSRETRKIYRFHVNEVELMEGTGLEDKNGVGMFEGDIIQVNWNDKRYPLSTFTVKWLAKDACWYFDGGEPEIDAKYHFEVIGNVHADPELVK